MIYLELFLSYVYIGAFSFGGGYTALTLMQEQMVNVKEWLTLSELADIITISEMTPGPLAINAATFVGMKMGSIPGAVAATLGFVFPAILFVLTLLYVYNKFFSTSLFQNIFSGIRPATIGFVLSAALSIVLLAVTNGFLSIIIFLVSFVLLRLQSKLKFISPIFIIILSGIIGGIIFHII
jgi:Chromate transport protein ChrA